MIDIQIYVEGVLWWNGEMAAAPVVNDIVRILGGGPGVTLDDVRYLITRREWIGDKYNRSIKECCLHAVVLPRD